MSRPSKYEMLHAMRYAHEHTKKYLMENYRQSHPQVFQYAHMDIRPATRNDYYIPPTLASECIVVEKTYFSEAGCLKVTCFPFRSDGLPCTASDPMHWSRVGSSHILSCQPSCHASESTVDGEWRNDTCVQVNPFKKFMALFPEIIFGVKSKNPLHSGLEWRDGKIHLNKTYCEAYGLEFDGHECNQSVGQTIGEYLFGTTIYRGIKIQGINPPYLPPPPPLPKLQVTVPNLPVKTPNISTDYEDLAREVSKEVAFDFGVSISVDVVIKILKKRAPALLTKAVNGIPIKAALAQMVLKQYATIGVNSLITAGKIIGGMNNVFTIYSIIAAVLDIFDPLRFGNLLTMKMLETIDKRLDMMYFGREHNFSPELTPEFVWDFILVEEDQSERQVYFGNKINEYLVALQTAEKPTDAPAPMFDFNYEKVENKHWDWTLHIVIMVMLITLAILFVQWIHVWAILVLFTIMVMNINSNIL